MTTTKIAFLGPVGTYSNEAAHYFVEKMQLDSCELIECADFSEVFDSVEYGRCDYGVVPTENSLEGPVTACLDNFAARNNIVILGETILDIHHCLVVHPDANPDDIDTILSHPQGLAQCRRFLNERYPKIATLSASSTAQGVTEALENMNYGAIANEFAANLYGAKIAASNIEDHFGNQTSFVLIASQGTPQPFEGQDKTSIAIFLNQDHKGTLLMILSELAYANLNLTKIQSRPTKQGLGDYMFFIDFVGSVNQPEVQTALNCLRMKLREVKILGSYPTI